MVLPFGLVVLIWSAFNLLSLVQSQSGPSLNVPACSSQFNYDWAFNSLGQTPCQIAGYLGSVCSDDSFMISPLTPNLSYGLLSSLATNCTCSTLFYNTLSACAGCQGAGFTSWAQFSVNCSTVYTVYPNAIPPGTAVPNWAYQSQSGSSAIFNATLAKLVGDRPESSASPGPTSTGSGPTAPAATASNDQNSNTGGSKTNAGAIAGGVVGGLAFLCALGVLAFWFIHRRRRRASLSSKSPGALDIPHEQHDATAISPFDVHGQQGSTLTPTPPPKIYNPNDPSTYPSAQNTVQRHTATPVSQTQTHPGHYHALSNSSGGYAGAAEI